MQHIKYFSDWFFKDFNGRRGKYVLAEAPNLPMIIFMASIILAVIVYPGFWQSALAFIAYGALAWWSLLEARSGRSRFRKLLGYGGILAVIGALLLRLGF